MNRVLDIIALFVGCLAILLFLVNCEAKAANLECFTDEPRSYSFELKGAAKGRYQVEIVNHSGKYKDISYLFVINNLGLLSPTDDFLIKKYTNGNPYTVTYTLYCKFLKK